MRTWFAVLPLHRKLIVMALAASAAAVMSAVTGLVAFDLVRFRTTTANDTRAVAQVIARTAAASLVFNDAEAAEQILASLEVRPAIGRGCLYRADNTLLVSYRRDGVAGCPVNAQETLSWHAVSSVVPVERNGRIVGAVYVERLLTDLPARVAATTAAGLFMLLLAAGLALAIAHRMQDIISRPIVSLAAAADAIGQDSAFQMPTINAPPDETGALVRAFNAMVQRLVSANRALTEEVEERRRMQAERETLLTREREASRLKDEFLAAVSHELRTPLNAIMGWTQVLGTVSPTPQMLEKALASLSRNAQAQKRVIEDLLDVSRITSGKLHLQLSAVDLRVALKSAVELVMPAASGKKIRLDVQVPSMPCQVQVDPDRMGQVFWNLLSNAVKFTPTGGWLRAEVAETASTFLVTVSDSGVGIASDFLPHVFERFRQADGTTTRAHGGLGLGLALVKELTELHGGTVSVFSRGIGTGASFTVTLPKLLAGFEASEPAPARVGPPIRLDGVEVLAVDDNADVLDTVAALLTSAGARVRCSSSGLDALDELRRRTPDILLVDIAMPGMDGFELLRRIHRENQTQGRPQTIAIALTAFASLDDRNRCLAVGFSGFVAKPFDATELIAEVSKALPPTARGTVT